jgi:hypothetical protein
VRCSLDALGGARALLYAGAGGLTEKRRRERLRSVPFLDGLVTGEMDALIGSFAGEPELHQPVRRRIKGARALERYAYDTKA